jgi:hypothetical protein
VRLATLINARGIEAAKIIDRRRRNIPRHSASALMLAFVSHAAPHQAIENRIRTALS